MFSANTRLETWTLLTVVSAWNPNSVKDTVTFSTRIQSSEYTLEAQIPYNVDLTRLFLADKVLDEQLFAPNPIPVPFPPTTVFSNSL